MKQRKPESKQMEKHLPETRDVRPPKQPGEVEGGANRPLLWQGEFQITSPPVVSHGLVIIGSAISDNRRADAPKGTVRAFDARSGAAKWNFDPVARGAVERPGNWLPQAAAHTGQANVWAPMRSEEHTSELQSLMRISYAVFCLKKKKNYKTLSKITQRTLIH